MAEIFAYLNIENLVRLNNYLDQAIENPQKDLKLKYYTNVSGRSIFPYNLYLESMENLRCKIRQLEDSKYYQEFVVAVDSYINKTDIGPEVRLNYDKLLSLWNISSRLAGLCYRADEIGYVASDEIIERARERYFDSIRKDDEVSIVEPIYKYIMDEIHKDLKEVKAELLPHHLKSYYDLVSREISDFESA